MNDNIRCTLKFDLQTLWKKIIENYFKNLLTLFAFLWLKEIDSLPQTLIFYPYIFVTQSRKAEMFQFIEFCKIK